jgi:seryl-tRNA synthetase
MLSIQFIRQYPEQVIKGLTKKHVENASEKVQKVLELDQKYRENLVILEQKRAELNKISKSIGVEMGKGNREAAEQLKMQSSQIKKEIDRLEQQNEELQTDLQEAIVILPNLPHESVPEGKSAEENVVIYENERNREIFEGALPHWELAKEKNIIDFETGAKITGAGFPLYRGLGAKLQRALINFFLDKANESGYIEIEPPILVNKDSAFGTGQLPDKEGQMYYIPQDELYLIPTAEVPITNIYRDSILEEKDLPIKNCGYTPCFRREAGSYGAHVRGLNRLHQFDKVEIVQITKPEHSYQALEEMVEHVKNLMELLELPFRIVCLCGGDMSFASAKTYDFEVWSAAQKRWLEVSSVSNFETFQANRLKLRYRTQEKKTELLHTLNGSALALPRIVAGILEYHQQPNGSILIPKALQPYFGRDKL